jgi:hypothetical protein
MAVLAGVGLAYLLASFVPAVYAGKRTPDIRTSKFSELSPPKPFTLYIWYTPLFRGSDINSRERIALIKELNGGLATEGQQRVWRAEIGKDAVGYGSTLCPLDDCDGVQIDWKDKGGGLMQPVLEWYDGSKPPTDKDDLHSVPPTFRTCRIPMNRPESIIEDCRSSVFDKIREEIARHRHKHEDLHP